MAFTNCNGNLSMLDANDPLLPLLMQRSLIGHAKSDIPVELGRLKAIMDKVSPESGLHHLSFNTFIAIFPTEEEKDGFQSCEPWVIEGTLISFMQWDILSPFERVPLNHVHAWVQIHRLGDLYRSQGIVARIGTVFPKVQKIEKMESGDQKRYGSYRIRVLMDVSIPLLAGAYLVTTTSRSMVTFKYEKLPKTCKSCGMLGHIDCSRRCAYVDRSFGLYGEFMEGHVPDWEIVPNVYRCDQSIHGGPLTAEDVDVVSPLFRCRKRKHNESGGSVTHSEICDYELGGMTKSEFCSKVSSCVTVDQWGRWKLRSNRPPT